MRWSKWINMLDGKLSFAPANESRDANAMSGTMRQLVNNMVVGVSKGFEKKLSLVGVGYKAQAQGAKLNLTVGYSHPVNKEMPAGITVADPDADGKSDQGCRPPARWPGGCRDSCHSSPGALQGQGHPLCG
jgi:ribosomal protein L6P/L9E